MWFLCNACYAVLVTVLVANQTNATVINDGTVGFLAGFSLFVAGLMAFKFLFALLYNIKWNLRMCCCPYYRKSKVSVSSAFIELRKKKDGLSSDEEGNENDHDDDGDNNE